MCRLLNMIMLATACCAVLAAGCEPSTSTTGQPATRPASKPEDLPMVLIYRSASNNPNSTARSGVVAAVWSDGRVLRASSAVALAQPYIIGKGDPSEMRMLHRILADARNAPPPQYSPIPDAGVIDVIMRDGGQSMSIAEPLRDSGDSLALRLRDFIYKMRLDGQRPTDFSGGALPGWLD